MTTPEQSPKDIQDRVDKLVNDARQTPKRKLGGVLARRPKGELARQTKKAADAAAPELEKVGKFASKQLAGAVNEGDEEINELKAKEALAEAERQAALAALREKLNEKNQT